MTAKMFDEINAVAQTFTVEQQRELIVFELKESIRAILEEPTVDQNDSSNLTESLRQRDDQLYAHMSQFIDKTLSKAYYQIKLMNSEIDDSICQSNFMPSSRAAHTVKFSQSTQTTDPNDAVSYQRYIEQVSLNCQLTQQIKIIDYERSVLSANNKRLQEFCSQVSSIVSETSAFISSQSEGQTSDDHLSFDDASSLLSSISAAASSITSMRRQLHDAVNDRRLLVDAVSCMLADSDRKGQFIVQMQKKVKESQSKLYVIMKQAEVTAKEHELLKSIVRLVMEESSWYQQKCGRIEVDGTREIVSLLKHIKTTENGTGQTTEFIRQLKEKIVKDQEDDAVRQRVIADRFKSMHRMYSDRLNEMKVLLFEGQRRYDNLAESAINQVKSSARELTVMQHALDASESHIQELSSAYDHISERLGNSEQNMANIENEVRDLKGQLDIKDMECCTFRSQAENAEDELDKIRNEISRISAEYDELSVSKNQQLSELKAETISIEETILQKVTQIAINKGIEHDLVDSGQSRIYQIDNILEKIDSLKTTQDIEASDEYQELQSRVDLLKLQIEHLEEEVISKQSLIDEMTAESRVSESIASAHALQIEKMEESLAQEVVDLRSQLADMAEKLLEANDAIDNLNRLKGDRDDQFRSLTSTLEQTQRELYDVNEELSAKILKIDEQSSIIDGLNERLENRPEITDSSDMDICVNCSQNNDKIDHLNSFIEVQRKELDGIKAGKLEIDYRISQQNDALDEAITARNRLECEIESLQGQVRDKDNEILELKQNWSLHNGATSNDTHTDVHFNHETESDDIIDKLSSIKDEKLSQNLKEAQEHMISQNRRMELLQMDLEEANGVIENYKKEHDDLKTKFFEELRTSAESDPEAKELLETLLVRQK